MLRWIGKLEEEGLVYREPDAASSRRLFVMLTDRGFDLMSAYIDAVAMSQRDMSGLSGCQVGSPDH